MAPWLFRVGSARKQTKNRTQKNEQTRNTKGFRLPRLQIAVYCNLPQNNFILAAFHIIRRLVVKL